MSSAIARRLLSLGLSVGIASTALSQLPAPRKPGTPEPDAQPGSRLQRTVADENANATPAATNGTLVARFTVKLVTPVPSGHQVQCGLTASVDDENKSTYTIDNHIYDTASTKASVSGSTATCTVTIPYSWYLSNLSTDTVQLTYSLYILNASATNGSGEARTSSQFVPGAGAIKVPANNATTTFNIAATL